MPNMKPLVAALAIAGAAGCATPPPSGPSHLVLPGTGKNFDQFRADDYECRGYASSQIGGKTPADAAAESGARSAAVGTVVGAAAGAAIGGGRGAAVGAGTGLAIGGLAGTEAGNYSGRELQRRYDIGYDQCMYAKGHRVPVYGRFSSPYRQSNPYPPPPAYVPPPPPPPPAQVR